MSHLKFGKRSKANDDKLQCRIPPHQESLKDNYPESDVHDQFIERVRMGFASAHTEPPFDPSWYVGLGTTVRKNDPSNPRQVDNHSFPHDNVVDSDGQPVLSFSSLSRIHEGMPGNPDENKHTANDITRDAAILRHIGNVSD